MSTTVLHSRTTHNLGKNPDYGQESGTQFQAHKGYMPLYVVDLEPIYERNRDFFSPFPKDDEYSRGEYAAPRRGPSSKEQIGGRRIQPRGSRKDGGQNIDDQIAAHEVHIQQLPKDPGRQ